MKHFAKLSDKAFQQVMKLTDDFWKNQDAFLEDYYCKEVKNIYNIFGSSGLLFDVPNTKMVSETGNYPIISRNSLHIEDITESSIFDDTELFSEFKCFSFAMYGKCNGDAMREPEFVLAVNQKMGVPIYMRVDWLVDMKTYQNYEIAPFPYWHSYFEEEGEEFIDVDDPKIKEYTDQRLITKLANSFFDGMD